MTDNNDRLFAKYTVRNRDNSCDEDGEFFVLRLGDPAADAALAADPRLAVTLLDRYTVVPAYAPTDTAPLIGCVALPITRPWPDYADAPDTAEARGVWCILRVYLAHVVETLPTLAASLRAILNDVSPVDTPERRKELARRAELEMTAARERLAVVRAERITQKAVAR